MAVSQSPSAERNERLFDFALFLKREKIMAVGDLHLGIESRLKTASFPLNQREEIFSRLEFLFSELKPKTVVFCGDLVENFSFSLRQKEAISVLFSRIPPSIEAVAIRGNHDVSLSRSGPELVDFFERSNYCFAHGDSPVETDCEKIVLGHEHPSLLVSDGVRAEKFKCFLCGESSGKKVFFLPSFSPVFAGADVLSEWTGSPFAKEISDFSVFVASEKEEARFFGRVAGLRKRFPPAGFLSRSFRTRARILQR